jgi:hypothetical protein
MRHCDLNFRRLLDGHNTDEIEEYGSTIYGAWPDLTHAYFNPAWSRFAEANRGEPDVSQKWGLGCHILDAIGEPLRSYYDQAWKKCLQEKKPWEHRYECSSADVYRLLHMTCYPLANGNGLLVVNATVVEHPQDSQERPPHRADAAAYLDANGVIHQCMHCRKVQCHDAQDRWDWIPGWVERSPMFASHTLCPICLDYYYPRQPEDDET